MYESIDNFDCYPNEVFSGAQPSSIRKETNLYLSIMKDTKIFCWARQSIREEKDNWKGKRLLTSEGQSLPNFRDDLICSQIPLMTASESLEQKSLTVKEKKKMKNHWRSLEARTLLPYGICRGIKPEALLADLIMNHWEK